MAPARALSAAQHHMNDVPKSSRTRRASLNIFGAVVGSALGALVLFLGVDALVFEATPTLTAKSLAEATSPLAEVMAAVLGLSLTVVAIVVQLASSRYPAKIVDLFMTDPLNVSIFAFMTSSCVYIVVSPAFMGEDAPMVSSVVALLLVIINFGILLPYFNHVFAFLEPNNIITQIQSRANQAIDSLLDTEKVDKDRVRRRQYQAANAIERIADNSMAAIGQSDRNLSMHTVRTLERFVCDYLPAKHRLPRSWAHITSDFLSTLAKEFLDEILENTTWVEAKALMEFERIFRKALGEMNELVSQIAASTRAIGEATLECHDTEARRLTIQFFNTYMRHTLNARNVRAAYNVLYEYRRFASELLQHDPTACVRVVKHLVYYGRTANAMGLPFVTVTVAHDVRVLCEEAYDRSALDMTEMLRLFLTLDQPSDDDGGEVALLGVRRAQSILGAFFMDRDAEELAEQIRFDMRDEPNSRLLKIRDDILSVDERKFWEVTDRGFNFDWVAPELRPKVIGFFEPLLKAKRDQPSRVSAP